MKDMYPRVGVGAFILNDKNHLLLILRNNPPEAGYWSIPGGKVEFMEKLEDAIIREIREEIGLNIKLEKLLCVTDHIVLSDNAHWVSPTFLVFEERGRATNREPHAIRQVQWFPLTELPPLLTLTTSAAVSAYFGQYSKERT